ncbi:hypothetical protein EVAR_7687_1 [Eumeta japonica]|uniref:Uncharacterized protein n=1 Tax=Eumeta variegata TaxID=151549 RepID=A0A4C1TJA0_EUMVA|nr:hypothetical protein EVAR_7687_1 [Eumeta japonica]
MKVQIISRSRYWDQGRTRPILDRNEIENGIGIRIVVDGAIDRCERRINSFCIDADGGLGKAVFPSGRREHVIDNILYCIQKFYHSKCRLCAIRGTDAGVRHGASVTRDDDGAVTHCAVAYAQKVMLCLSGSCSPRASVVTFVLLYGRLFMSISRRRRNGTSDTLCFMKV